jgi:hypothetical protein
MIINYSPSVKIISTKALSQIKDAFNRLLYIPNRSLKPKIIDYLLTYLQRRLHTIDYKMKIFVAMKAEEITGIVICQIDDQYKSYGRKCGTFSWLNVQDFESCQELMKQCEVYMKENKMRKLRGPINFPKMIGGIGYQIEGFEHKMMSGVAYNRPDLKELEYLQRLGYRTESNYTCVHVTEDRWEKGNTFQEGIQLKLLTLNEMKDKKKDMMEMAKNTFHTIMPDASGGEERLDEFFKLYNKVPPSHYRLSENFDPWNYTNNPLFVNLLNRYDLEKVNTWVYYAFDRHTDEMVGFIFGLPNLFQIWENQPLTDVNIDTVMIRKSHTGKGIFSALNNFGRIVLAINSITYVEGTSIWSNNKKAINTIFPHSKPIRKHVVFQKRI